MISLGLITAILCLFAACAAEDGMCNQHNTSESCCSHDLCTWTNCSSFSLPVMSEYLCVNLTLLLEVNVTIETAYGNFSCLSSETACTVYYSTPPAKAENTTSPVNDSSVTVPLNPVSTVAASTPAVTSVKLSSMSITSQPAITAAKSTLAPQAQDAITTAKSTLAPQAQDAITTAKSTLAPQAQDAAVEPDCSGRRFDGASFIGGIVLCGGLVLIGAFVYKYYQSRVEARYHQF